MQELFISLQSGQLNWIHLTAWLVYFVKRLSDSKSLSILTDIHLHANKWSYMGGQLPSPHKVCRAIHHTHTHRQREQLREINMKALHPNRRPWPGSAVDGRLLHFFHCSVE